MRPASHWPAVLRLALTLRALGAPSDPLRFALLPSINCAPVPTAWARGASEGLSLSLRARSLSVAFRASDVVVHVQGAQARSPEEPLVIPGSPFHSVQALIREFGLWTSFDRPFRYCTFFRWRFSPTKCFCTTSLRFSITLLTSCDIFLVPLSGKTERQRIRLKLCRVCKDFSAVSEAGSNPNSC